MPEKQLLDKCKKAQSESKSSGLSPKLAKAFARAGIRLPESIEKSDFEKVIELVSNDAIVEQIVLTLRRFGVHGREQVLQIVDLFAICSPVEIAELVAEVEQMMVNKANEGIKH